MSTEFQPDGYVYILKAGPYYKIGRTQNPSNRIKSLQISIEQMYGDLVALDYESLVRR